MARPGEQEATEDDAATIVAPDRMQLHRTEAPGWRKWVVLFGSFQMHVLAWGPAWGSGVFQMIFMDEFGGEGLAATISVIPTLVPALMSFSGPVASVLTNRLGCRAVAALGTLVMVAGFVASAVANSIPVLCVTFATVGVGTGLAFIPSIVILTQYFERRLPIAVAVASSGLGVGVFLFPPLMRLLQSLVGWRAGVLIYAGILLTMLPSAFMFQPVPLPPPTFEHSISTVERKRKTLRVKMMKQPPFLCLVLNNVLLLYGIVGFYIHLPSHAVNVGYTENEAAMFPSVAGVATLVCRVLVGVLVQRIQAPVSIYTISMIVAGLAVVAVPFLQSTGGLLIACTVYGLGSACLGPLLPLIMNQLVGQDAIGDAYGYVMVAEGIGSLLGPPIAGALFDASASYQVSLCVAGGAMILSSVVMLLPLHHVWTKTPSPPDLVMGSLYDLRENTMVAPLGDASGALLITTETDADIPTSYEDKVHATSSPTESQDSGVVVT